MSTIQMQGRLFFEGGALSHEGLERTFPDECSAVDVQDENDDGLLVSLVVSHCVGDGRRDRPQRRFDKR
jgi:hypothetical protein